ncbi:PAC2 family protein [Luteipulveratus sp. YIM 133132]|uniref:PAC2 family protein n=1 Tax=Luteipulveratus flavus TaxID=3031728 RepID=UPI0023AFD93E|nr:PAC2 family protein [Luteipulveratus sp. YIM 133132]MDE9366521.1 PAC2 family protein [Luteipulveratus sp. YIM 133132]
MIQLEDLPELRDPIMIAAFEGWNDAGETATSTLAHLARMWDAEPIAALDPEEYYDFQVNRPRVTNEDGRRTLRWPTTRILLARDTPLDRDVVLVQGIEPSMRWASFTDELITLAEELEVSMLITLGGLLADVPHTRPIPVTVTSEHEETRHRYDLETSLYEGPTGIVGVVVDSADRAGIASMSIWAAVPHYAGGSPSPKATLALLTRLEELFDTLIGHADLADQARAWEHGVDELASSDDEVAEYVHSLEEAQDTTDLPEASGDAIAKEFERYLRRRQEDED